MRTPAQLSVVCSNEKLASFFAPIFWLLSAAADDFLLSCFLRPWKEKRKLAWNMDKWCIQYDIACARGAELLSPPFFFLLLYITQKICQNRKQKFYAVLHINLSKDSKQNFHLVTHKKSTRKMLMLSEARRGRDIAWNSVKPNAKNLPRIASS